MGFVTESGGECLPVLLDAQVSKTCPCLRFGMISRRMALRNDGQPGFVYRECERLELLLPDMEGVDFADTGIVTVLADDQHRFGLVAHLRADMSAHIVVPFVQVKHAMDVQVILRRPLHHLVDDFHGFAGAVDVEHQVTDSVNNHQTVTLATAQCVIDHLLCGWPGNTLAGR